MSLWLLYYLKDTRHLNIQTFKETFFFFKNR